MPKGGPNTHLGACACIFQRTEHGAWEDGVAVLPNPAVSDVLAIVNASGDVVQQVWDYQLQAYRGAFSFEVVHGQV